MSKYAGAALPEQAKRYVRQCILGLPVKWASAIEGRAGGASGRTTRESTVDGSEMGTPRPERMGDAYFPGTSAATATGVGGSAGSAGEQRDAGAGGGPVEGQDPALRPTEEAADRILTFAVESLDMLRSVTGIFSESVERAETCVFRSPSLSARLRTRADSPCTRARSWIERLRIVGLDRQRQQRHASSSTEHGALPPSSPQVGSAATFSDDGTPPALAAGTKRRRTTPSSAALAKSDSAASRAGGADAAGGGAEAVGASTALDAGQTMDEGDEGAATRRKRGAWRTSEGEGVDA